jgi:hypothetical protein
MKSYKKIILFGILFVSFAITISLNVNTAAASQSGIYVSPTGHDTWNGQNPTWNGKDGPKKTIKNAVGTVSSGGTVKIAGGTYYEHGIIISKSMNINGESRKNTIINAQYLGNIFTIKSGLTVTISNLRLDSGKSSTVGAIHNSGRTTLINTSFTNNRANNSAGAIFNKYGSLNIIGSSFTNNKVSGGFGGAIYNRASATVSTSTFTSNTAITGGGSISNIGYLSVNKSNFTNNHVIGGGGAIRNALGTVNINGCNFVGNNANGGGGAVFNENGVSSNPSTSTITITSSKFNGNTAANGGAFDNNYGKLTANYCTFTSNSATSKGGAIVNYHGSLTVSNSNASYNKANNLGGVLYNSDRSVNLYKCNFSNNRVINGSGGAIYNYRAPMTITGSTFKYNTATGGAPNGYSGAIHSYLGTIRLTNCSFIGNHATIGGGAIVNDQGSTLIIHDSKFTNNTSLGNGNYGNGGAIYTFNAHFWAANTTFTDNSANRGSRGGGAIDILTTTQYLTRSSADVISCKFINNTADNGGSIHNEGGKLLTVTKSTFIGNIASHDGGAIYTIHGALKATYNDIENNHAYHYGAAIFNSGHDITVQHNNIVNNIGNNEIYSPNNMYSSNKATVDARYNWWGDNDNPSGKVSIAENSVIISPWLSSPQKF